jgi:RNA polymerase sigma factor (sigma-70 family)
MRGPDSSNFMRRPEPTLIPHGLPVRLYCVRSAILPAVRPDLDSALMDELYAEHAATIQRFCVSQVGFAAAEDLTHETFMRAWSRSREEFPAGDATKRWLIAVARNLCVDHLRRRSRRKRLVEQLRQAPRASQNVELEYIRRLDLETVQRALDGMRPRDRELVGLRVAAGLSYREIAEITGSSEQIVKVATFRALGRLRSHLATPDAYPEAEHG